MRRGLFLFFIVLLSTLLLTACGETEPPDEVPEPQLPIQQPTEQPSEKPTEKPTEKSTEQPGEKPTELPTEQPVTGYWEGAYSWAGARVVIRVNFKTVEGGLAATMDIPEQNIKGLELRNVGYDSSLVHFEIEEYGSAFDGEMEEDTITGELLQSGVQGRFTLNRGEAETEEPSSYPWPALPYWFEQATPKPAVTETVVQEGDLVLSGDETLELTDVRFILKGNMVLHGRASFKASNVILEQPQEYNRQYGIQVRDDATFELNNVFIDSGGPWLNIDFKDSSRVSLTRIWGTSTNIPWYTIQHNTQVSIEESVMGMTPFGDYTGDISIKSSSVMLELSIPGEGQIDVTLPFGYTPGWNFPTPGDSGIAYEIQVEDSWLRTSGMGLSPGAHVTVRDTEAVVLLFGVGWNWSGAVVELRDLQPGYVEDRTWEADGAVLRVVNTYINEWYPNAGGNGELILIDSKVNEMEPWGEARLTIRNSRLSVIHANDEVEMRVYDSSVDFDVVARDQAVIYLYNTTVGGNIFRTGDSKIYIDGVPLDSLPSVGPGFVLGLNGSITDAPGEVIDGQYSIKGSYTGSGAYNHYLRTVPAQLPLTAGETYEVTFDYLILDTPDEGFEVLFYSPQGGDAGQWLPSNTITGQAGDTNSVTMTNTLLGYDDYMVAWNIVGMGAIAIDNIRIVNVTTGETIATEDLEQ